MGSFTTSTGYRRTKPTKASTPGVDLLCMQFTQDPTAAAAATGKVLPKGAIPLWVSNMNGLATGGSSPTVDVGISGNTDGYADELDADGVTGPVVTGALLGVPLTADTEIWAGVGASAATGGSVLLGVYYIMQDTGRAGTGNVS
jgi:hypothetical protein